MITSIKGPFHNMEVITNIEFYLLQFHYTKSAFESDSIKRFQYSNILNDENFQALKILKMFLIITIKRPLSIKLTPQFYYIYLFIENEY